MYPQTSNIGAIDIQDGVRVAMRRVYLWMTLGLLTTAVISWLVASTPALLRLVAENLFVFYGAVIVELILVFALSAAINKLSPAVAALMFFGYAALNGVTLSLIFKWYADDFGGTEPAVLAFLNKYRPAEQKLPAGTKFEYSDYDWRLNDQSLPTR